MFQRRFLSLAVYLPGPVKIPSYLTWNHFWASSLVNLCGAPIRLWHRRRRATRWPGRSRTTKKSIPKIPIDGSYLIPKSICSWIPKPKQPKLEKLFFLSSYSLTFKPASKISSAFGPRTVTRQAIFSFLRIPKDRTVNRALEKTGLCPVSCSKTLAPRVSLSPDSPTHKFKQSLAILISFITFCFGASAAMAKV